MLEMDDAPTADSIAPTGATANMVSLFQVEATAMRITQAITWKPARPNSVVQIAGVDYTLGS